MDMSVHRRDVLCNKPDNLYDGVWPDISVIRFKIRN